MESELQSSLVEILKELEQISVTTEGSSEKGDGYIGDILFATVKGTRKTDKSSEEIHVVVKWSKQDAQFRKRVPVHEAFLNEITVYDSIFPAFRQFELGHGIKDPFQSVAKCYGNFVGPNKEVIVFENLKKSGFELWNRKLPLPKDYLRVVLAEYAKFHAISVAMQDQEPERFEELSGALIDAFKVLSKAGNFEKMFGTNIDEMCDLLRGDVDDSVIQQWKEFKNYIDDVLNAPAEAEMKVIAHGDCWCNNFMFKLRSENKQIHPIVAIIDWQVTRVSSPILDLSYFLFCAISKQDISSLENLLGEYFEIFSNRLQMLGSSPNIYGKEAFFKDWRKYCNVGLMMSNTAIKICLSETDEVPDIMESVGKDLDIADSFTQTIGNEEEYKERMSYIIEYAVKEDLLRNIVRK